MTLCVYSYLILISTDFNKSNVVFVKSTLIDRLTFLKSGREVAIDALTKEMTPSKAKKSRKKQSDADFTVISLFLCLEQEHCR